MALATGLGRETNVSLARPLWRLLEAILRQGGEVRLTDFRKVLHRVTVPAGRESVAITAKMFRQKSGDRRAVSG